MANYTLDRQDHGDQGGHPHQHMSSTDGSFMFPYEDPAIINPDELASFPKTINTSAYHTHESHLVSKRTPLREGRNITITDNHPDKNGFV
jgi:hypothetical protein